MPLLLFLHLFLTLKEWLRKCLGMRRFFPFTQAPVLLVSLLLLPGLTGKLWRASMCLYTSTPSLSPLMRPPASDFFLQLLPPVPVPWPSPLLCPMLATAQWHSIGCFGSPSSGSGVPLLSSVLVGSSSPQLPYSCPECHCTADIFGDHQVGCGGNGDRIMRHNAISDVIFCATQSAALAPSIEFPNLISDSLSRPADIYLPTLESWSSCYFG